MVSRSSRNQPGYILGVDGGGSKTTAQIADTNGKKIAQAVSGSSSYKSVGVERATENLNAAVLGAIKNSNVSGNISFISSCFGFAGNNTGKDPETYRKIVFNSKLSNYLNLKRTVICNDTRLGLEAGSENTNKIILIAGTGSNCFGVNEDSKQAGATGWDYILADEGSGYQVGLKALRAIIKAYDGRGRETLLSETILKEIKLKNISDIPEWVHRMPFSKAKIGELAKTVCRTAGMGDKVSIDILTQEAKEAVISVITVAHKLGFKDKNFDLVLVGGLFRCEKYFKNILINRLKENFPKINFIPLKRNPVEGAIKIAIKKL
jgi:N-acetylglucosamine kinase-like BadF-type ATPase